MKKCKRMEIQITTAIVFIYCLGAPLHSLNRFTTAPEQDNHEDFQLSILFPSGEERKGVLLILM